MLWYMHMYTERGRKRERERERGRERERESLGEGTTKREKKRTENETVQLCGHSGDKSEKSVLFLFFSRRQLFLLSSLFLLSPPRFRPHSLYEYTYRGDDVTI